jgi:predicted Zn-dependent protease
VTLEWRAGDPVVAAEADAVPDAAGLLAEITADLGRDDLGITLDVVAGDRDGVGPPAHVGLLVRAGEDAVWGTRRRSWSAVHEEYRSSGRPTLRHDRDMARRARPLDRTTATAIVVEPLLAASIVHAAVGHTCEADNYTAYGEQLGVAVGDRWCGAPELTIADDPTRPGHMGSYAVDDEGTAAARTVLVAEGRWQALLTSHDHCPAGHGLTGNGRTSDPAGADPVVTPRNSVLVVEGGRGDRDDLLHGMGDGFYCGGPRCCLSVGRNVAVEAAWAMEVRGGRITGRVVGPVHLRMRKRQLLLGLRAMADDVVAFDGFFPCMKGGDDVLMTMAAGHMLFSPVHLHPEGTDRP